MNKDKSINPLFLQDVYSQDGTVNKTKVNVISGNFTPQLADALRMQTGSKVSFDEIEAFWWELYDATQYAELAATIKTTYILIHLQIPEVIDAIMKSKDKKLLELYYYEFLMDIAESKSDYQEDGSE